MIGVSARCAVSTDRSPCLVSATASAALAAASRWGCDWDRCWDCMWSCVCDCVLRAVMVRCLRTRSAGHVRLFVRRSLCLCTVLPLRGKKGCPSQMGSRTNSRTSIRTYVRIQHYATPLTRNRGLEISRFVAKWGFNSGSCGGTWVHLRQEGQYG